jgi:hypothetical protein
MPHKQKVRRKTSKEAPGKTASKDFLTGFYMTSIGPVNQPGRERVEPDKIYTVTEADVEGLPNGYRSFEPGTYPLQYEFEFNRNSLVATIVQASGTKSRDVYIGEFGYTNGLMTSAKVFGYANRFWIPEPDGSIFESGFSASVDGQSFAANPDRVELWFYPPFSASSTPAVFSQINSVLTDDQGKAFVTAFGGGKLLADGWHNEPFASNLI